MSRYLVTGGAGFIGSHLCDALLAAGHEVRVLDDLSTGRRGNLAPGIELVVGDVGDTDAIVASLDGVAGCFHLAAVASVERCLRDWPGTHRVNLSATVGVLDAIRRLPAPVPFVYASSAAVYGHCDRLPITEDAATRPLSAYGADKLGCEHHARVAGHVFGIPTVGLRFFNVYGPRQDPRSPYSGVISIFCDRLRRGDPVELFGDGGQTRDFVFVADVVAALLAAMARPSEAAALAHGAVFNVCTGRPTSVRGLAETIAGLLGRRAILQDRPPRAGEIRDSVGSPARARAALGLHDPRPLTDGLAETLAGDA